MKTFRLLPLLVAVSAALVLPVQAQSLVTLYESARSFDASYQSAKSQYDATLAKSAQAKAAILPSANLAIGVSRSSQDMTPGGGSTSSNAYGTQNATLSASQPLYRPGNWASYQQGKKQKMENHKECMQ